MILKKVIASISIALLTLIGSAMLLCNWSATGWKALAVPTASMHPAIPQNSLVLTHKVPISSLKVGDVITYVNPFNPKQTISHRIIKTYLISGKIPGFVTKGDANTVADVPIAEGSVVGKVVWHVPHAGAWLLWAKKPIALLPLIYLPALLLMAEEVQRLSAYYKWTEPYRLYSPKHKTATGSGKFAVASALGTVCLLIGALFWQPALALLKSNPVALANNQLSVAATTGSGSCTNTQTTNNNSVTVTNSSTQSVSSGSTSTNSSTNGSATSGNVSNSNSTTTTITINNGC